MRPGSNAMELITVSEKCNGLLIREDHPGLTQLGHAAPFPSDKSFLDRLVLSPPTGQFIRCVSMSVNGRQLHAIVDLSRRLGNLC
jgi:hypothetical protein